MTTNIAAVTGTAQSGLVIAEVDGLAGEASAEPVVIEFSDMSGRNGGAVGGRSGMAALAGDAVVDYMLGMTVLFG